MADGFIKSTIEPPVCGRKDNKAAAWRQMIPGTLQLCHVILNVLQNINIEYGIECFARRQRPNSTATHFKLASAIIRPVSLDYRRQLGVRFEANPARLLAVGEDHAIRSSAGADLQDCPANEAAQARSPIAFPMPCPGEELQFRTEVSIVTHWRVAALTRHRLHLLAEICSVCLLVSGAPPELLQ